VTGLALQESGVRGQVSCWYGSFDLDLHFQRRSDRFGWIALAALIRWLIPDVPLTFFSIFT